ncbi:MAG: putative phage-associated protein [Candidatus Tokpelaia sp. JSC189]|nr:MAG: putative phage-associated protein [Candidatus Tokpelaia sp. JSC189]
MHDSSVVANQFLILAQNKNNTLTLMQLLKLVYIAHGWMLGLYGRPLIRDEVQAWQYGPVIPRLYNMIRSFKSNPVEGDIDSINEKMDEQEVDIVDQVYQIYGQLSGPHLSRLTHQASSPWHLTYKAEEFGGVYQMI